MENVKIRDFKGFNGVIDVYNSPNSYMYNYMAIYRAVQHFKRCYSHFEKRLATTKKKACVQLTENGFYVSINFNKKHYGQFYLLNGCDDFNLPTRTY